MAITISVGQALLILIDYYQKELLKAQVDLLPNYDVSVSPADQKISIANIKLLPNKIKELKILYLVGAVDLANYQRISELLTEASPFLKSFSILADYKVIDDDPSRRYFETHLAYETLRKALKCIDMNALERHLSEIIKRLPKSYVTSSENEYRETGKKALQSESIEFIDALQKIDSKEHYLHFEEEDRKKLRLLMRIVTYGTSYLNISDDNGCSLPIDVYQKGYFASGVRGRIKKKNNALVTSSHLGIMRSYHPVPINDIAHDEKVKYFYLRPADRNTYESEAAWVVENFARLVHPFSASIAGTLLAQLRILKSFQDSKALEFNDIPKMARFLQCFTSMLLYNSGGHTFHEFFAVLAIPQIKEAFKFIPHFERLNKKTLLYDNNKVAFDKALADTLRYHDVILKKAIVHQEITMFDKVKRLTAVKEMKKSGDAKKDKKDEKFLTPPKDKKVFSGTKAADQKKEMNALRKKIVFFIDNFEAFLKKLPDKVTLGIFSAVNLSKKNACEAHLKILRQILEDIPDKYASKKLLFIVVQYHTDLVASSSIHGLASFKDFLRLCCGEKLQIPDDLLKRPLIERDKLFSDLLVNFYEALIAIQAPRETNGIEKMNPIKTK